MKIKLTTHHLLASLAVLALAVNASACTDDGGGDETPTSETSGDGDGDGDASGDGDGDASGDGDGDASGDGDGDPAGDGDGDATDTDPSETDTDDDPFVFDESPADDYAQVDRMGMPAINTAVIASKDEYNADSPASDLSGTYVPEIVASLEFLHGALDDDIMGAGLTPCDVDTCVAQAGPLVIPDTLKLSLADPAGFPNGRLLEDPVMDVTLAVVLLDLSVDAVTSLVGLNPTANDVAFNSDFPYLADPN